jgi:polyhydroxyalkanoate synthesis regulator phasin
MPETFTFEEASKPSSFSFEEAAQERSPTKVGTASQPSSFTFEEATQERRVFDIPEAPPQSGFNTALNNGPEIKSFIEPAAAAQPMREWNQIDPLPQKPPPDTRPQWLQTADTAAESILETGSQAREALSSLFHPVPLAEKILPRIDNPEPVYGGIPEGVYNVVTDTIKSVIGSPGGIGTMGLGTALNGIANAVRSVRLADLTAADLAAFDRAGRMAAAGNRAMAGAFTADMGMGLPEQLAHFQDVVSNPNSTRQQIAEATVSPVVTGMFIKGLAQHAMGAGRHALDAGKAAPAENAVGSRSRASAEDVFNPPVEMVEPKDNLEVVPTWAMDVPEGIAAELARRPSPVAEERAASERAAQTQAEMAAAVGDALDAPRPATVGTASQPSAFTFEEAAPERSPTDLRAETATGAKVGEQLTTASLPVDPARALTSEGVSEASPGFPVGEVNSDAVEVQKVNGSGLGGTGSVYIKAMISGEPVNVRVSDHVQLTTPSVELAQKFARSSASMHPVESRQLQIFTHEKPKTKDDARALVEAALRLTGGMKSTSGTVADFLGLFAPGKPDKLGKFIRAQIENAGVSLTPELEQFALQKWNEVGRPSNPASIAPSFRAVNLKRTKAVLDAVKARASESGVSVGSLTPRGDIPMVTGDGTSPETAGSVKPKPEVKREATPAIKAAPERSPTDLRAETAMGAKVGEQLTTASLPVDPARALTKEEQAKPPELMTPEEYLTSTKLKAAVRDVETGEVVVGKPGEIHALIAARSEGRNRRFESGWSLNGKFLTPKEAEKIQGQGDARRAQADATHKHKIALTAAQIERVPISAAAVDAYGIKLPKGYIREGGRYVFKPEVKREPTPASGSAVTPEETRAAQPAPVAEQNQPTPPREPRKWKGNSIQNTLSSEEAVTGPDIIRWLLDQGGVMSRSAGRRRGKEWFGRNGSEWDDAPGALSAPYHNQIYGGERTPSTVAQAAYEARLIDEPSASALWAAVKSASEARVQGRRSAKANEKAAAVTAEFADQALTASKGDVPVDLGEAVVGDKLVIDGEEMEIVRIDPNTGEVFLKDGTRWGTQVLDNGETVYAEKYVPREADETASGWDVPDATVGTAFQPSAFTFEEAAQERSPTAPDKAPRLLSGEKQGDLISSTQREDFALAGEKATDFERVQAAQAKAAADAAEAKRIQDERQMDLEAKPEPAPVKEPWQMTKAEWRPNPSYSEVVNRIESSRSFNAEEFARPYRNAGAQVLLDAADYIIERGGETNERAISRARELRKIAIRDGMPRTLQDHKKAVQQALREGKPVPPEVLADYPELNNPDRIEVENNPTSPGGFTVNDVTPKGYGPVEPSLESSDTTSRSHLTTEQQALLRSIGEGRTMLKGKLSAEKRAQVERAVSSAQAKLDATGYVRPMDIDQPYTKPDILARLEAMKDKESKRGRMNLSIPGLDPESIRLLRNGAITVVQESIKAGRKAVEAIESGWQHIVKELDRLGLKPDLSKLRAEYLDALNLRQHSQRNLLADAFGDEIKSRLTNVFKDERSIPQMEQAARDTIDRLGVDAAMDWVQQVGMRDLNPSGSFVFAELQRRLLADAASSDPAVKQRANNRMAELLNAAASPSSDWGWYGLGLKAAAEMPVARVQSMKAQFLGAAAEAWNTATAGGAKVETLLKELKTAMETARGEVLQDETVQRAGWEAAWATVEQQARTAGTPVFEALKATALDDLVAKGRITAQEAAALRRVLSGQGGSLTEALGARAKAVEREYRGAVEREQGKVRQRAKAQKEQEGIWARYRAQAVRQLQKALAGGASKPSPALQMFTARLVRNLRAALDTREPGKAATLTAEQLVREALTNAEKYREVWDATLKAVGGEHAETLGAKPPALVPDTAVDRVIRNELSRQRLKLAALLKEPGFKQAETGRTLLSGLVKEMGLNEAQAKEFAALFERRWQARLDAAREKLLGRLALDPKLHQAASGEVWRKLVHDANTGVLTDKRFGEQLAKRYGVPEWTPEIQAEALRRAMEISQTPEGIPRDRRVNALNAWLRSLQPASLLAYARENFYTNIFAAVTPPIRNVFGNLPVTMWKLGVDAVQNPAAFFDVLRSGAPAFGVKEGLRDAASVLATGEVTGARLHKYEEARLFEVWRRQSQGFRKLYGKMASRVTGALVAGDVPFYRLWQEYETAALVRNQALKEGKSAAEARRLMEDVLAYGEKSREEAKAQAIAEGLSPNPDIKNWAVRQIQRNEYWRRVDDIIQQKRAVREPKISELAKRAGLDNTFNSDWDNTVLQRVGRFIASEKAHASGPMVDILMPVVKVIFKGADFALENTPLTSWVRAAELATSRNTRFRGADIANPLTARRFWTSFIMSHAAFGVLAALSVRDEGKDKPFIRLHGRGPTDANRRKQMPEGWQPHSLQIGNRYVNLMATGPLMLALDAIGNMQDAVRYENMGKEELHLRALHALSQIPHVVLDQVSMQALADLLGMANKADGMSDAAFNRMASRVARTAATVIVPGWARQADLLWDSTKYTATDVKQAMLSAIPFVRQQGKPDLDWRGLPMQQSPFDTLVSEGKADPLGRALTKLGVWVDKPAPVELWDGVKMTGAEQYEFVRQRQRMLYSVLRREMLNQSPTWKALEQTAAMRGEKPPGWQPSGQTPEIRTIEEAVAQAKVDGKAQHIIDFISGRISAQVKGEMRAKRAGLR